LAAEIKKEYGIDAVLTKGKGGIFDVKVDGKLIFSKHASGRFPEVDEVLVPMGELIKT
jgi:selenoprotein W-related protein